MSLDELSLAISEGETDKASKLTEQLIKKDVSSEVLLKGLSKGLTIVGDKWDRSEVFLAEVLMAVETFETAAKITSPYMKIEGDMIGTIVLGTVKDDIHYIGKSIVAALLKSAGFKVLDLGEDVSATQFCEAVEKEKPDILGMSCLISTSLPAIEHVLKELEERKLRKEVKVMIGGAPITREFVIEVGGDLYAADAFEAVKVVKEMISNDDS
jgi:5-methyltetrahydrofolate--homocysteine methyltransferase